MGLATRTRALLTALFALACGYGESDRAEPAAKTHSEDPRAVLTRAAAALRNARSVAYDFEWGGPESPAGWATGHTLMRRVHDVDDSWIRVVGTVQPQPAFGVEELDFDYAFDGERAWVREGEEAWRTAPVGGGANHLAVNAVLGYLPEFVEARPLWKELGSMATARMLAPEEVGGELCEVVEVSVQPPGPGEPSLTTWSIARGDHLPRRGRWSGGTGTPSMVLTLTDLEVDPELDREDFRIDEAARDAVLATGLGALAPDFALASSAGTAVTRDDLAGRVVVLDFWNTWCYLCRAMAPEIRRLAEDYAAEPVTFLGVNVFEVGDPLAYWRQSGNPYPTLLAGDDLAHALDLPWQPGIVVLGHDGTVLFQQLGASPDRAEAVRSAVEEGLARLRAVGG